MGKNKKIKRHLLDLTIRLMSDSIINIFANYKYSYYSLPVYLKVESFNSISNFIENKHTHKTHNSSRLI